jgi:heptosyltransferase-2
LLGGKDNGAESELIQSLASNKNVIILAGKLSFLQSAALMKYAIMNYVNDSAPLHFASAVNAPVTAIFCSTVPTFGFTPLSDKSFIVETKQPLKCRPCGLHGYKACPLGHFKCAHTIETRQVLETIFW